MRLVFAFWLLFLSCLAPSGRSTATTLNELQIGVRVFDFMTSPPRAQSPLAVIYDAQNTVSADDARAIVAWLQGGVTSAKAEFRASLVDARRLDEFAGYRFAIVANGSAAYFNIIYDYAKKNQTLTVSADLSCMRSGKCAVGVTSVPRVDVIVNRSVASSCSVEFSEAFRMMVKEY
jgi:cytolysin (calcineurin-like family phosphatase)